METGLLHDYFGNFSMWGERYYFHVRLDWTHMRWDWNKHQKTWKLWKIQISFLGGGDLWWWYLVGWRKEVQIGVGVVGVGGAMAGSQMGQGVGARSATWQEREGIAGGKRARWQLLGVVGQEGQMVGEVGQEADGREPAGAGAVWQGGPKGQEGGDGRVH